MSRMPMSRLARIGTWTGAALAWGTTAVFVKVAAAEPAETATTVPPADEAATLVGPLATMPEPPSDGLVILRFTPVTAPPPEIIVKTRYVQVEGPAPATASSSTSGSAAPAQTASTGGSSGTTAAAPPPPPAASTVTVTPTTQPPAPVSSGS